MIDPLPLLLAPDPSAFREAARPLVGHPDALDSLVPVLLEETALRHYRESYPKHVPHALFALLGGLESADLLEGPERTWPVLQALSYVARERKAEPWPIESVAPRGDERDLAVALNAGAFEDALGAVAALAGEGRMEVLRDTILTAAVEDAFNVCHRFLYAAKVLFRLARRPGPDPVALLFPVVHYMTTAPRDGRYRALLSEPPGREPREIFATAVRHLSGTEEYDWVPVAHAATVAEASLWWSEVSDRPETARARRLAELFLPDALAEGRARAPDPGPAARGTPEELLSRLSLAIAGRDEATARAAARGLEIRGDPRLGPALLVAGARIDGALAFSHDVKVAAAAVRLTPRPGPDPLLSAVAAFLARLPPGEELARALF